eukprot:1136876-Pelagomonas_calceolata.AAC.2
MVQDTGFHKIVLAWLQAPFLLQPSCPEIAANMMSKGCKASHKNVSGSITEGRKAHEGALTQSQWRGRCWLGRTTASPPPSPTLSAARAKTMT